MAAQAQPVLLAQTSDDPGDETQRNYRYQYAYGVILLIAMAVESLKYRALWCEHFDDFLAERNDGRFDAFQIKTRKPENGPWEIGDEGFWRSIARFVSLKKQFPDLLGRFVFVSNAEIFETKQADKLAKSPVHLVQQVRMSEKTSEKIDEAAQAALDRLSQVTHFSAMEIRGVIAALDLQQGPSRDFEAIVAHEHVSTVNGCEHLSKESLDGIRDDLIDLIWKASSLSDISSDRHYACLLPDEMPPEIRAKRVTPDDLMEIVRQARGGVPFRLLSDRQLLRLGGHQTSLSRLEKKLMRGGLNNYVGTMRNRAISAEAHLIELAHREPERMDGVLTHLTTLVQGECDDAHALASNTDGVVDGLQMYKQVLMRLRDLAAVSPEKVERQEAECLIGLAALLTEQCSVWWSAHFDVANAS